ncbi:MAG: Type 1 glutamine amidotransferase-like domain-containing protein [bacterium]|nr:Type 1 glutamine amidotransferase-like domain-containing protein [bacterium]
MKIRKLLLSSSGSFITDGIYDVFDKPRNQIKWAYITTAGKSVLDDSYLKKHRQRMNELGWDFEEIDIEGKNKKELTKLLNGKEAVFVEGGNTFYLIKQIRLSGFDKVMRNLLDQGVVYVGSSAGSYVTCPTMEMATWKENENDKFDHCGVTDFTGMNFVPFLIVAHYTPDLEPKIKHKIEKAKFPVKLLTDRQAIYVNGKNIKLLEDRSLKFNEKNN